jgi:hypothetical protein
LACPASEYNAIFGGPVWDDTAQRSDGWWNGQRLKLQLVSKRKRLMIQWEKQTGYEKILESTPRQVFQQAGVPWHKADAVGRPAVARGLRPVSTSGCVIRNSTGKSWSTRRNRM